MEEVCILEHHQSRCFRALDEIFQTRRYALVFIRWRESFSLFYEMEDRSGPFNDLHWVETVEPPKIIGQVPFKEFVHRSP